MGEPTLFPNASTKDTLAYCWRQMQPDRAAFTGSSRPSCPGRWPMLSRRH